MRILRITLLLLGVIKMVKGSKMCHDEKECDQLQFCHFPSNTCAPCVDCQLYRRTVKADSSCCKDPQECGGCIEGFTDEILGDGTIRTLCMPLNRSHPDPFPPLAMSLPSGGTFKGGEWVHYGLGIAGVIVSAAFIIGFATKKPLLIRVQSHSFQNVSAECEAAPNLYAPSAPTSPYYHAGPDIIEEVSFVNHVEREEDNKQRANKFLDPQYVTSPSYPVPPANGASLDEVDASHVETSGEAFFDENTLPSNWSPGPDYVDPPQQGISQLTSFDGVLRLNASNTSSEAPSVESVNHTAETNIASSVPITQNSVTTVNTG